MDSKKNFKSNKIMVQVSKINKKNINDLSASKIIIELKKKKKIIGLCHGTFDLLHLGHIKHFKFAKNHCDILFVSVTHDKFVNKGFNRPIFNTSQRCEMLNSLDLIDHIIVSRCVTAEDTIRLIKPDLYFKGPDYKNNKKDSSGNIFKEKKLVEKFNGKIIYTDDETFSSSRLIANNFSIYNEEQENFLNKIKIKYSFSDITTLLNKLSIKKFLVIGENIIDRYVFCDPIGKSGKEPHIVLRRIYEHKYAGGALAIANHISSFVNSVDYFTGLGKEVILEKKFIKSNSAKKIKLSYVYRNDVPTIIKTRFIDRLSHYKIAGIYDLNDKQITSDQEQKFKFKIINLLKKHDNVIVADYGHGLLTQKLANEIIAKSKNLNLNAQLNASNLGYHNLKKYRNFNNLLINEAELRHEFKDKTSDIKSLAKKISFEQNIKNVVVTRGLNGVLMYNKKKKNFYSCPAFASKVIDKVGAGDALFSVYSLLSSIKVEEDLNLFISSVATSRVVETVGNSVTIDKNYLLRTLEHMLK